MDLGTAKFRFMFDGSVLQLKRTGLAAAAADTGQKHQEQDENWFYQSDCHTHLPPAVQSKKYQK